MRQNRDQNAKGGKRRNSPFKKNCLFSALGLLLTALPLWAYVPGKFYYQGHTKEKIIALTFDDGPGPTTLPLLDFLKQHHIHATFFMLGDQIEEYPSICKAVVEAGMEVGNHTYHHFDYHKIKNASAERLTHELAQTEADLQRAANIHTKIVRMPYGYFNHTWLLPTLKEHGYALVHWTFGCDWEKKYLDRPHHYRIVETAEEKAQAYIDNAAPGAVFLFHDGGRHREKTLQAVQIVVNTLEKKGYRFVAAEDMFKDNPPVK